MTKCNVADSVDALRMKILVVGSGGREHALTWKLRESQLMTEIYCAPGNAGIAQEAECLPVDLSRPAEILDLAVQLRADLTVVGPEAPLIAAAILSSTGSSTWISWYLVGCAVIAMIALLLMPRRDVRTAPSRFDEAVEGAELREAEGAGAAGS